MSLAGFVVELSAFVLVSLASVLFEISRRRWLCLYRSHLMAKQSGSSYAMLRAYTGLSGSVWRGEWELELAVGWIRPLHHLASALTGARKRLPRS